MRNAGMEPPAAGNFYGSPALFLQGTREKKVELDNRSPPFLVWKGGCGAAGKVVQSYKAHMRQTEVISSGQTAPSIQVGLFKPSRAWEGGAGGDGWVVLSLQVEIDSKEKSGAAGKVVQSYMSKLLKECLIS